MCGHFSGRKFEGHFDDRISGLDVIKPGSNAFFLASQSNDQLENPGKSDQSFFMEVAREGGNGCVFGDFKEYLFFTRGKSQRSAKQEVATKTKRPKDEKPAPRLFGKPFVTLAFCHLESS